MPTVITKVKTRNTVETMSVSTVDRTANDEDGNDQDRENGGPGDGSRDGQGSGGVAQ